MDRTPSDVDDVHTMIDGLDRICLRVRDLNSAAAHWTALGATITHRDTNRIELRLNDSTPLMLHQDASLPDLATVLRVRCVRSMHREASRLGVMFLREPFRGRRGWIGTIRTADGQIVQVADHDDQSAAGASTLAATSTSPPPPDLFGNNAGGHDRALPRVAADRDRLDAIYVGIGRTADDLPYTPEFEQLFADYAECLATTPTHQEVWRHLLTMRKAGKLTKLGAARSKPPAVTADERKRLVDLLGTDIGRRDRLPYSPRFDEVLHAFNQSRRPALTAHQLWRLIATLAK
jgi:hypothetical protein